MTGPRIIITKEMTRNSGISAPPCEVYRCKFYNKCKYELLACRAFHLYTVTNRRVPCNEEPTRERYNKIYVEDTHVIEIYPGEGDDLSSDPVHAR